MHEIVTYQSLKENPKGARDTNVSINKKRILKVREILKCQSIKENPKRAPKSVRNTNVSINKKES